MPPLGRPSRLAHVVHPGSRARFGKLAELAPGIKATAGDEEEPKGLAFQDPDGEIHVYYVSEADRLRLVAEMAGGIIPATPQEAEALRKLL